MEPPPDGRAGPGAPAPRRPSSDAWLFFTKFLKLRTVVGSIVPSSRWYARRLVAGIDFATAATIVELGAGTGPVTAELLRRAGPHCRILAIERDPDFCARLRQRFPTAEIVQDDAVRLEHLLTERGLARVDHVICGLALPWLPPEDRHTLLDAARRVLAPHGSFRQLTYMPWLHTRVYRRYFARVGTRLAPCNVPPAAYYLCREPRAAAEVTA